MISELEATSSPNDGRCDENLTFSFNIQSTEKLNGFSDRLTLDSFFRWGLNDHHYVKRFSFDQRIPMRRGEGSGWSMYEAQQFMLHFFNDPAVKTTLQIMSPDGTWGKLSSSKVNEVRFTELTCFVTSLGFFDRLYEAEIVTKGNHIRQQLGTTMYFPGNASITVSDELRRCLLLEGSDGYGGQSITQPDYYEDDEERDERCARVFSAEDRKEFIFNVFKAIVLGGGVCQFDETVGDYLAVTKMIYKDLVSVTRDRVSNAMAVANYVYRVEGLIDTNNRDIELFPVCHPQNFFFLSIDPVKRVVSVWYHGCPSFFQ